jgi:glutaredoxin
MVTVEIYSKADCCLCDDAKAVLHKVRAEIPFDLREIDIETDPELLRKYGQQIPVVFIGGFKAFKFRVDEAVLRQKLCHQS